jgi:hypothetical protein
MDSIVVRGVTGTMGSWTPTLCAVMARHRSVRSGARGARRAFPGDRVAGKIVSESK